MKDPNTCSLLRIMGCNLSSDEKFLADRGINQYTLRGLANELLRKVGIRVSDKESVEQLARKALSSSELPNILKDAVRKVVLDAYSETLPSYQAWSVRKPVTDLNPHVFTTWSVSAFDEPKGEGADPKHDMSINDAGQSGRIERYMSTAGIPIEALFGESIADTREMAKRIGVAARQTALRLAYGKLMKNPQLSKGGQLFKSDRSTLVNASTLDADAVGDAAKALRNQCDPAGNRLNLDPATIIVPPSLENEARKITREINQENNPWQRPIYPISEPLLEDNSLEGSGENTWYMAASPDEAAVFAEITLDNSVLEVQQEWEFSRDVLSWYAWLTIGFAPISDVGMVKIEPE